MGGKKSPKVVDTEAIAKAEAEAERKKTIERQRRGIEGTIKTSYLGILSSLKILTKTWLLIIIIMILVMLNLKMSIIQG